MIAPLAPALPPLGAGAHYDASVFPIQKFSAILCTGNTALSQLGRLSGGAEPLERQIILNDFYRALFRNRIPILKLQSQP